MTIKEELHQLVDELDELSAQDALDYLRWLMQESETVSEQEIARVRAGEAEIERGEYTTLDELQRRIRG